VPTSHSGWNSDHHYNTRFWKKILANSAAILETAAPSIDQHQYSTFIAMQDNYPIYSGTNISALKHLACAASTNPDVLHYSDMIEDPDHPYFEQDMVCEVGDLLQSQTVECVTKSSAPPNLKILPAIWSFC
jgi:exo-beta-1,3-glucanase (GH17 family)